jgi:Bacterial conjugation TrbI-like protein
MAGLAIRREMGRELPKAAPTRSNSLERRVEPWGRRGARGIRVEKQHRETTMKRIFIVLLALILFEGRSLAQATAQSSIRIAPGTVISAVLLKGIDARKAKVSDKIEAQIVVDLSANGSIVIPKGSKIVGHVTEAQGISKDPKNSRVGIVFDTVSMKDRGDVIILAVIQAIGPAGPTPNFSTKAGFPMAGSVGPPRSGGWGQASDKFGGSLDPSSQGVVGLKGLELSRSGAASVVSSSSENVRLESGTQLILRTEETL